MGRRREKKEMRDGRMKKRKGVSGGGGRKRSRAEIRDEGRGKEYGEKREKERREKNTGGTKKDRGNRGK